MVKTLHRARPPSEGNRSSIWASQLFQLPISHNEISKSVCCVVKSAPKKLLLHLAMVTYLVLTTGQVFWATCVYQH